MRKSTEGGLLTSAALIVIALSAGSAHAQDPVSFIADTATLSYGTATVVCETSTLEGTRDSGGNLRDLEVAFLGPCSVPDGPAATADCDLEDVDPSTIDVIAQTETTGTLVLNDDFKCEVVVESLCTFSVEGPQTTQDGNVLFGQDTLSLDVDMQGTRTGSLLCGPPSGTLNWAGVYEEVP